MSPIINKSFTFFLLTGWSIITFCQENDPYSREGFGTMYQNDFVINKSIGGVSAPFYSSYNLNYLNPASYSRLKFTTLETGLYGINNKTQKENLSKMKTTYGSISYLSIGFPVTSRLGGCFGLMPFTKASYNINNIINDPIYKTTNYLYEGSGNLHQIFIGSGYSIINLDESRKALQLSVLQTPDTLTNQNISSSDSNAVVRKRNLSVGFNLGYLFGTLFNTRTIAYNDMPNMMDLRFKESISANDLIWNAGLQYAFKLNKRENTKEDLTLGFGINGKLPASVFVKKKTYWETGTLENDGGFQVEDTVFTDSISGREIDLPMKIGFGVMLARNNHWMLGVDIRYAEWSKFRSFGASYSFANKYRFGIGGEIRPNKSAGPYWKRVKYRLGGYYGSGYLQNINEPLEEFGITFGLGLPLRKKIVNEKGKYVGIVFFPINISFEIGQFGTLENDLYKVEYFKTSIGFTLNDKWFLKRKYD